MQKIWISRDKHTEKLNVWTSEPESYSDGWGEDNEALGLECSEARSFLESLLGSEWIREGSFCVEITIASIQRFKSPYQKIADKLRNMTKASFRKATIAEAVKMLEDSK